MSSRKYKGQYDGKIAGLYDLEETIGRGHFAVVKLARHVFTGEKVAVKVIDKTKLDDVSKAHLFQEVRCMKLVQHPNVVRLYEVIDTQTKLYLILELGDGGDMYDYIMKHDKGLGEEVARRYFNQIVQAINYCHKLHVVHRDLKPENVVFFEKLGIVKLTDFGFSNKFIPGRKLETSCGSLAYSAPEILLGDSYDAPAVDVWSLGVILYMLVCGEAPFQEANDSETLTMIMDCKYRMPTHVSEECQNVISQMLVREPRERAKLEGIINHTWLQLAGQVSRVPIMPLISREDLPPEDHDFILQKMVEGKIATMEEILQSLENDSYDHITATFYLLAERRLRRHHEAIAMMVNQRRLEDHSSGNKPHLAPLALSPRSARQKLIDGQIYTCTCDDPSDACPCVQSADTALTQMERSRRQNIVDSLVSPPGVHPTPPGQAGLSARGRSPSPSSPAFPPRRCSLIHEESIEEDDDEMDVEEDDLQLHRTKSSARMNEDQVGLAQGSPSRHTTPTRRGTQIVRPLHSVRSSPQLLNQIFEEGESEDDDIYVKKLASPRMHIQRKSLTSPEGLRKYDHRKKRLTSSSRGTSCSSSDASDTDETDSRKRKEKLKQRMHRRDSDHSSDTDGPSGPGPSGGNRSFRGEGSGKDRDKHRDRDSDRDKDRGGKGGNNENKEGYRGTKERRHSLGSGGGKQNSVSLGKRDLSGCENLPQLEVSRKISTLSVGSNLSNLSLTSITSRSSKYLVESSPNTPRAGISPLATDIDALNEENKARTKIIHVRSKEFSDLMDRFGSTGKNDNSSTVSSKESQVKFRRRSKEKMKTDINRNGLIAKSDGELTEGEAREQQNRVVHSGVVTTKCCSLV